MGQRGELFSTRILLQNRTYFFNVKENRLGDLYLNIVESKNREDGQFDRQSVILFADDLQQFLQGFDESLRVLEKEMRERRRSSRERNPGREDDARSERSRPSRDGHGDEGRPARPRAEAGRFDPQRPGSGSGGGFGGRPKTGRFDSQRPGSGSGGGFGARPKTGKFDSQGPRKERTFREGPPPRDRPSRDGYSSSREGPPRDRPSRDGYSSFREGPPRDRPSRDGYSSSRDGSSRDRPSKEGFPRGGRRVVVRKR